MTDESVDDHEVLRQAAAGVLDDMGVAGTTCSAAAKALLRLALGADTDPTDPLPFTIEHAQALLAEAEGRAREGMYDARAEILRHGTRGDD